MNMKEVELKKLQKINEMDEKIDKILEFIKEVRDGALITNQLMEDLKNAETKEEKPRRTIQKSSKK